MNVEAYRRRRLEVQSLEPVYRKLCETCRQPDFSCFCEWIKPFDPGIDFIILTHPIEQKRRRIVTGRMSHLSLINSQIIVGHNYTGNRALDRVIEDQDRHCMMLYPGRLSQNLTPMTRAERWALLPEKSG